SVASFYFASRAAAPATTPTVSRPELTSIDPNQLSKAAGLTVDAKIVGRDLQLAKNVSLEQGNARVTASSVLFNTELITCAFTFDAGAPLGKYNVAVTTSDGATATLPDAFEVTA